MIANDNFLLTVAVGSIIIGSNNSQTKITEVPVNALQLWENGNHALCLRKKGIELLQDYPKERIQKLIEIRTPINFKAELELLKSLLKDNAKKNTAAKPTVTK
jgi:hypothetical protein